MFTNKNKEDWFTQESLFQKALNMRAEQINEKDQAEN